MLKTFGMIGLSIAGSLISFILIIFILNNFHANWAILFFVFGPPIFAGLTSLYVAKSIVFGNYIWILSLSLLGTYLLWHSQDPEDYEITYLPVLFSYIGTFLVLLFTKKRFTS